MATSLDREGKTRPLLIDLAIRFAIGSLGTWLLLRSSGLIGLVFAAPLWGLLLTKPIVEIAPLLVAGAKRSAWSEGDVDAMTFETHRLRIRLVAGYPWILDEDLLGALGEKPSETLRRRADPAHHAQLPDSKLWGYSEAGAAKYLSSSRHPDANKLKLLLERQVFFPARRKRESSTL
jgi:hypothetical protein